MDKWTPKKSYQHVLFACSIQAPYVLQISIHVASVSGMLHVSYSMECMFADLTSFQVYFQPLCNG